ncbi:uncharacterized protein METZ01_LOCUS431683, partial [marine metagenome]
MKSYICWLLRSTESALRGRSCPTFIDVSGRARASLFFRSNLQGMRRFSINSEVVGIFSCILFVWPCLSVAATGKAIGDAGVLVIEATPVGEATPDGISVVYHRTGTDEDRVEVKGLSVFTTEAASESINVYTADPAENNMPAIMGRWVAEADGFWFKPRFSFQSG